MTSAADLEKMRVSKQIIRTDKLISLLKSFGFKTRRSGGGTSHIFVYNPDFPEIPTNTIVSGTSKVVYQRKVIDACLAILKLQSKEQEHTSDISDSFQSSSENVFQLPDHLEIIRGRKSGGLFLRSRNTPQVATELINYKEGDDLTEYCAYVDKKIKEFVNAVNDAIDNHDFERIDYPNGAFILSHPKHPVDEFFPPFTPRLQNFACVKRAQGLIEAVEKEQKNVSSRLEIYINRYKLKAVENGESLSFTYRDFFQRDDEKTCQIPSTPNGYYSLEDAVNFEHMLESNLWGNFKRNISRYYGFDSDNTPDANIRLTHLIFSIEFVVPDLEAQLASSPTISSLNDLNKAERREVLEELDQELIRRKDAYEIVIEGLEKCRDLAKKKIFEFNDLLKDNNLHLHDNLNANDPRCGKIAVLTVHDNQCNSIGQEEFLLVRPAVSLGDRPIAIITYKSLARLKERFSDKFQPKIEDQPIFQQKVEQASNPLDGLSGFGKSGAGSLSTSVLNTLPPSGFNKS